MAEAELLLAIGFSILAALAAIGFVAFREPVHAALSFAVTVLAGSGLYLLLDAHYAAVATVIVYAGATIIIFLFALMFAQQSTLQIYDRKMANPLYSVIVAVALTGVMGYVLANLSSGSKVLADRLAGKAVEVAAPAAEVAAEGLLVTASATPRVADLGRVMYTQYLWAIELAGAILLVATLGAIHIARDDSQAETATDGVPS